MPANPKQRKRLSPERLEELREKVKDAFNKRRGEEIQISKDKENPYYKDLIDDILEVTDKSLSKGTILKFFTDDNHKYQISTIQIIEEYIDAIIGNEIEKKPVLATHEVIPAPVVTSEELKVFARRIYIELKTRKAAIPIDEDNDVIEEIYDSWYKLFCTIRDEMKTLPVDPNPESITGLAMKILNEVLRPHLTEHQASYRKWLEAAKNNPKNKNTSPQELQRKYPGYEDLLESLIATNKNIIKITEKVANFPPL